MKGHKGRRVVGEIAARGGRGEGHRGRWQRRKEAERERSVRGAGDDNLYKSMLAPVHCQKG